MSKIIQPFGALARRIVINVDDKNLIQVFAEEHVPGPPTMTRKARTQVKPMDSREMVLVLIRVVTDYTAAIFASLGDKLMSTVAQGGENGNEASNPNGDTGG